MCLTRNRFRTCPKPRRPVRKPVFDRLETRTPLTIGAEFLVNTATAGEQSQPAVAENTDGRTVVVWRDVISSTRSAIKARIYSQAGVALTGELTINNQADTYDYDPSVAINASGKFVVAWTVKLSTPTGNTKVRMAEFTLDGQNTKGPNVWKAVTPIKNYSDAPSVGIDDSGKAVVAYELNVSSAPPVLVLDAFAKRYSANGDELGLITVGATTGFNEYSPSVGEQSDGIFAIGYTKQTVGFMGDASVVLNTYTPTGAQLAPPVTISGGADFRSPSVAWQSDLNGVIAYTKKTSGGTNDIKAKTFALSTSLPFTVNLSPEIDIQSTSASDAVPSVGLASNGRFAVSYTEDVNAVRVTEAVPTLVSGVYAKVTFGPYGRRTRSAFAMGSSGRYTVVYQTVPRGVGSTIDIRARRGGV